MRQWWRHRLCRQLARQVDAWHAAGLASGGKTCKEAPGIRQGPGGKLYLAYLRDLDGNKICAMHRVVDSPAAKHAMSSGPRAQLRTGRATAGCSLISPVSARLAARSSGCVSPRRFAFEPDTTAQPARDDVVDDVQAEADIAFMAARGEERMKACRRRSALIPQPLSETAISISPSPHARIARSILPLLPSGNACTIAFVSRLVSTCPNGPG